MARNPNKIHDPLGDKVLQWVTGTILVLFLITVAYPIIFVISCSFSSDDALSASRVVLWPVEFSLESYKFISSYKAIWQGFKMSIFYTAVDLVFQTSCTIAVAYPLSRRYFHGKRFVTMFLYMITRFSAGLIPTFILKCDLGLFNNIWAILLSGNIAVSHMFMLRTSINANVPEDLFDSARIDGANHLQSLVNIAIPLVKATLAVLCLYAMVGSWNEYFTAMLYLRDAKLYPLQLVLRPIMTAATAMSALQGATAAYQEAAAEGMEGVRYALIVMTSIPPIVAYMLLQKNFKGGVMLGSVKG